MLDILLILALLLMLCTNAGAMVLCPDGNWVVAVCPPAQPRPPTLCPDGTYVTGQCVLAPNGRYVGR